MVFIYRKGLCILLLILGLFQLSKAQDWFSKIDYRMEIGTTMSYITNMDAKSRPKLSGIIGGSISVPILNAPFYASSGLFITQKGVKLDYGKGNIITAKPTYIQLPLSLSYRIDFSEEKSMFLNIGGYMGVGVTGKFDFEGDGFSDNTPISVFSVKDQPINKYDLGLETSVLYEYMTFVVRFGGSLGLLKSANTAPNSDYWNVVNGKKPINIQVFLSIGYRFFNY